MPRPPAPKCDRCGLMEGTTRPGKMQPVILTPTIQVGRTWKLCQRCRSKLGVYVPIPRA